MVLGHIFDTSKDRRLRIEGEKMKKIALMIIAVMIIGGCGTAHKELSSELPESAGKGKTAAIASSAHKELSSELPESAGKGKRVVIVPSIVNGTFVKLPGNAPMAEKIDVTANMDRCIAAALKAEHPDANIIIGSE